MRFVWLANSTASIMHAPDGHCDKYSWRTRCGRNIQSVLLSGRVIETGLIIRDDRLNLKKVRNCQRCYR